MYSFTVQLFYYVFKFTWKPLVFIGFVVSLHMIAVSVQVVGFLSLSLLPFYYCLQIPVERKQKKNTHSVINLTNITNNQKIRKSTYSYYLLG